MAYTPSQLEAIDITDQNLQIIACAGSGKTQVVSARVVNILRKHVSEGIMPEHIVAFTFTDKAAAELKDRIAKLYRDEFGNVEGLAGMYVGTIHSFCLDILQRYLFRYLKYDVLDEVRQRLLVDRYYRKSGMASMGLRRWIESGQYIAILGIVREAETIEQQFVNHPVRPALASFQKLLDEHRYLDYSEIMLRAVNELHNTGNLRQQIAQRVKYLIVDEYQDVNPLQETLIRELHNLGANLCVVGDDDQNVYQWRGSDVHHILKFASTYPNVAQKPLEVNFRSTPPVVKVARRAVEMNTARLPKAMRSGGQRSFERGDLLCLNFADPEQEASWIADKILTMRGTPYYEPALDRMRGLSWSDFSILLRSVRRCAAPIVAELTRKGVPYIVSGMTGLFDTLEVQAAVGIFAFLAKEIGVTELKNLWRGADLGLTPQQLDAGVAILEDTLKIAPDAPFSAHNLQRVYLQFLGAMILREDQVPNHRGELTFYNLGKFSKVIADYEEIHFKTRPEEKYYSFVQFLRHQAPNYYPEGGQDAAYAVPDAVRIMTVHQAKGTEFPVVFIPCLQRNRFPARRQHNRVWDHIPRTAIVNADRFDGNEEDERRLFYVALTRSEKYLFCSWAYDPLNRLYRKPSIFFTELTWNEEVLTRDPGLSSSDKLTPEPRRPLVNVEFTFSDLKYLFECPYLFKLHCLYGFSSPLHEAMGYGRSLHNVVAEVHRRALAGDTVSERDVDDLLQRHLHVPYAYPKLEDNLRTAAQKAIGLYLREHDADLRRLEHVEEAVELTLPEGIIVHGRIDLIKRTDTGEVVIVDFKSTERAQAEEVTRLQLHVYALGYEQRFGRRADLIEVHNLDQGGSIRELVDDRLTDNTLSQVAEAGHKLRNNHLTSHEQWCSSCERCDLVSLCRNRLKADDRLPEASPMRPLGTVR